MSSDSREWTEEELQSILRHFGRHLVALVHAYRFRNEAGELEEQVHFECLSGFVVNVGSTWYVATAGHNIEDSRRPTRMDRPIEIVGRSLAAGFGIGARRVRSRPYNLFEHSLAHAYFQVADIDYAFGLIDPRLRMELEADGVEALQINESRSTYSDFYGYGIVGFPMELTVPFRLGDENSNTALVAPVLVPIRHISLPTPENQTPNFTATVVNMGNQTSMSGMSGGPVLGYRSSNDGHSEYEVVAIQSQWNGSDTVIGCLVTVALAEARSAIRAKLELDE